jgi:hypothetical protein
VSRRDVAIIGAGPYGLSLAAHLAARGVRHRIFGRPMEFWAQIADAGGERNLKSFCFGTNISTPTPGFTFADYNAPRGLETFEPCSIANFVEYGQWFQQTHVPWVEPVDVTGVERSADGFAVTLQNGEALGAGSVVVATGLAVLPSNLVTHTSKIDAFEDFKGRSVAVVGGGQSALEAAALLREAGAQAQLIAREEVIGWQTRTSPRRTLWRMLRSPISGLGTGPKAWGLVHFAGLAHRLPDRWRTEFVKTHLPPEGAWWLRSRVEGKIPIHAGVAVTAVRPGADGVELVLRRKKDGGESKLFVEHVVAGTGYVVDVDRLGFLSADLRRTIARLERAPRLNATFESSAPGLFFVGPASAMSFGPMFRFVVGAEYASRQVCGRLA